MSGDTAQFNQAAAEAGGDSKREQSSILFPYLDLNTGIEVAKAIYQARGHGGVEAHELAAQMGQTISGAFRLKTGTARIFGLTERDGRDAVRLSELGRAIIEPETEKAARAEAFMKVPLYAKIYEKYKGQRLPPMKALEREMIALGVSSKQADKARQAFDRSAKLAGYREHGDDRLVRPKASLDAPSRDNVLQGETNKQEERESRRSGGGDGGTPPLHPFIKGLLDTLPPPETAWSVQDRAKWLQTASAIFGLIYSGDGEVVITAMVPQSKTANDLV